MTAATTNRSVADALSEVARWRADEETRHNAELVEVDQEVQSLQSAVQNLQQQLEALAKFRGELVSKGEALASQEVAKTYEALFETLKVQSAGVRLRSDLVAEAEKARLNAMEQSLQASDVAPLLEEYRQFKTAVEPTLASLPESYRSVMLQHHEQLSSQLQDHVGKIMSGPVDVEADVLDIEVVFAIDAPEATPELLIVVVPVEADVYEAWQTRGDDLQTQVMARVLQSIYEAVKIAGPTGAEAMAGGHQGLLAVEVDLMGAKKKIGDVLAKRLNAVLGGAPEFAATKLNVTARSVPVDYLLPPEDADQTEGGE